MQSENDQLACTAPSLASLVGGKHVAALAALALVVAGCGLGRPADAVTGQYLTVGTTDKVSSLDPAGSYDNGSLQVMNQVYPFLMNFVPGSGELKPDIAQRCDFTAPTTFTCKLKPNLKFANGHALTSSDVKFSIDRENAINDPNGPQSLLANLDSVETPDPLTVDFKLKLPNDQTFPQVLATNAGPIIDEEVFPADKVLDDDAIADAEPFAGPFTMTTYSKNQLIGLRANPDYQGLFGKPKTELVGIKYYANTDNLKIDIENQAIDVAWRSLSPTDIEGLRRNPNLVIHEGPGGELRYIVFNMNTMPGDTPAQKLAIRKAIASSLDRDALARDVYKGTYAPAYSVIPEQRARRQRGVQGRLRRQTRPRQSREIPCRRPSSDTGTAEPAVQPRPLRGVVVGGIRRDQGPTRRHRAVPGQPAVHRMGDLHRRARQGCLPDLPARLVPRFPRRRQLPDAVLHPGQLPGQPLREPARSPRSSPTKRRSPTRPSGQRSSPRSRTKWPTTTCRRSRC